MKKDQDLNVITKTYDLNLWSCNPTRKFPRNHRFVLGERIEGSDQPSYVRSANRNRNAPTNRNKNNGFRPPGTWQQDAHPVPPEFESFFLSRRVQPSPGRRPVPGDLGCSDE